MNRCSHYTPAEDSSMWAYYHRTWGCPDEGAVWPDEWEKYDRYGRRLRGVRKNG